MTKHRPTQNAGQTSSIASTTDQRQFVLTLNAGSSSLKFALFQVGRERILTGAFDRLGTSNATFKASAASGSPIPQRNIPNAAHVDCLDQIFELVEKVSGPSSLYGIGHRVVHGGATHFEPEIVTPELVEDMRRITPFAPEHMPAEIGIIEAVAKRMPDVPQVLCFDTAFHRDLPRVARVLPIPRRFEKVGVRRYGFHGLSYGYLMETLVRLNDPAAIRGRIILSHLGNGASMAAVRDGRCIDTTMAFTPAAGLVMGRRTGDLDPGVAVFLARTQGVTTDQFDHLANHESGMYGVSETTSDMRELLALESCDLRAAEAVELFCYQARKWIGAFTASLGGLDTLVFAGGIGEHSPAVRGRICAGLDFLGLQVDEPANQKNSAIISSKESRVTVRVIETDEESVIVRSTCQLIQNRCKLKSAESL